MYINGVRLIVSDPHVLQGFQDNYSTLLDKGTNAGFNVIMNKRTRNNVLALARCPEQLKRRRTFSNGFSGAKHFEILDGIIQKVLTKFIKQIKESPEDKVHDLRELIIDMFE